MLRESASPMSERAQLEHDTAEKVFTAIGSGEAYRDTASGLRKKCLKNLASYSDETLHLIAKTADTYLTYALCNTLTYGDETEDYIIDWINLDPFHEVGMPQLRYCINGLAYLEYLEPRVGNHYPERRIAQASAVFRVAGYLDELGIRIKFADPINKNSKIILIEDDLVRWLLTTHSNPGLVADLIIHRGIHDMKQVKALADSMSSMPAALNDGAL